MDGRPVSFVQVSDREAGVAWYRDVAGLTLRRSDDFGDVFAFGDGDLRLTAIPGHQPSPHPAIGWNVPDLAAAMAALKSRGATFEIFDGFGQDADGVWTAPGGGSRLAWFKDCAGNTLVLSGGG